MIIKTRFAPSPTGYIHVGNVRAALLSWLFAKKNNGQFILRFDDTDTTRSKKEYADAIIEDMNWLGLTYDYTFNQQDRIDFYDKTRDKLIADGRLYACYETPIELEYAKKRQLSMGKPPIYDRKSLNLTEKEKQYYISEGRKPHYRFKLVHEDIIWNDLVRGNTKFHGQNLSDPVFIREDGSYLYQYTSVIDDIDTEITHIIRGEDHVSNTAIQIQLFKALGSTDKIFAHLPIVSALSGAELSKRTGAMSIRKLREDGVEAMAINNMLFLLGQGDRKQLYLKIEDMIPDMNIKSYNKSGAKFDDEKMLKLTSQLMHQMPLEIVRARLNDSTISEEFWHSIRSNLNNLKEVSLYKEMVYGNITPILKDDVIIKAALETFPNDNWNETTWKEWTDKIKELTGITGAHLFKTLRYAILGVEHSPEMKNLLPLIDKNKVKSRLEIALNS